jgi:hypothetical protein
MRQGDRPRPSNLARLGGRVAVSIFLLSLSGAPSSAAAREPTPDPSRGTAAGTAASGHPAPEPEPQSAADSSASHGSPSYPPPSSQEPADTAPSSPSSSGSSAPTATAPSPAAASNASAPATAAAASSPSLSPSSSSTPSAPAGPQRSPTPQAGHVAPQTRRHGAAAGTRQRLASHHTATPPGLKSASKHDPLSTPRARITAPVPSHREGILMLLGSLALGLLVLASLALLRRLRRLASVWHEEPQL